MDDGKNTMKMVYTVVERGPGKSYWTRVGVGFTNRDGSLNLRLDAIPTNGTLQVRDWEPRDDRDARPDARHDGAAVDGANGANGRSPRGKAREMAADPLL